MSTTARKGNTIVFNKGFMKLPPDPHALRVVAPIGKENANYYALINQENGLCMGIHVEIDEVFFFAEYRDDTLTSIQERRSIWGKNVRYAIGQTSKGNVSFKQQYDKTKFQVSRKLSQATEVLSLAAAYELG